MTAHAEQQPDPHAGRHRLRLQRLDTVGVTTRHERPHGRGKLRESIARSLFQIRDQRARFVRATQFDK